MSFNNNITPGAPPLLWSNIYDAFTQINENFDILVATIGDGSGLTPISFETLDSNVKPSTDNIYSLGDSGKRWTSLYVGQYTDTDLLNGLWLGTAQIKGVGATVNLPANSTVGGNPLTGIGASLIIDPEKTFFKEIQVDNNLSVVATSFGDTVNLLSGSGISLTVSSGSDSIEIDNTGILSVAASSGILVSTVSGAATITNDGVRTLQSTTALPAGRSTGAGINISATKGDNVRITNTGVISIVSGVGITVSTDAATGEVQITNAAPASNAFAQIEIDGDSVNRLLADSVSDVLSISSGQGISLSKNTATDSFTISVNPVFDLKGSVFGDDSSVLVDGVNNFIYGNVRATTLRTEDVKIILGQGAGAGNYGVGIGYDAGKTNQGDGSVAVGLEAGNSNQGNYAVAVGRDSGYQNQATQAVAIGFEAGLSSQGSNAIAIGYRAGYSNQTAGSIILNASGTLLNATNAGFYVNPIRSTATATGPAMYNPTTKELFYNTILEFAGSTISTNDSSGITVDVQTTFNTDVRAENDLTVVQTLTANLIQTGNIPGFVSIPLLQSVVAASSSFSDFQARIAALV